MRGINKSPKHRNMEPNNRHILQQLQNNDLKEGEFQTRKKG